MNNKKLKSLVIKGIIAKEDSNNISKNACEILENDLVLKALKKGEVTVADIMNATELTLKALSYPSVRRCLVKKMSKFHVFFRKFDIKNIFRLRTQEQLFELVKESQNTIKRSPFSFFKVPSELFDEIHEMKKQSMGA